MNFHPQEPTLNKTQASNTATLQIDDLNCLIDSLKRREENIIQLLDYNIKYKGSGNQIDIVHLRGLYIQLNEREKRRIDQENVIIQKYNNLMINDDYQKKLMSKMRNKILQLNSSAREKLVQLGIYQQAKQAALGIANIEEVLGYDLNKLPIDVNQFLSALLETSRKRFSCEIDLDMSPSPPQEQYQPPVKQKSFETNPSIFRSEVNLAKAVYQKGLSPLGSAKNVEEPKARENVRIRNVDQNILSRKELAKLGRISLTVKSVDSRPSFEFRDDPKSANGTPVLSKGDNENISRELARPVAPFSSSTDDSVAEQMPFFNNINNVASNREPSAKNEGLGLSINLNSPSLNQDKASLATIQTTSSRTLGVKKIKMSANKKSMCLVEEPSVSEPEKKDKDKEPKVNPAAWLKSYDILKIEYIPLPTATKKETKKLLLEKVFKELLGTNMDIKRTVKRYRNNYLTFAQRRRSESEASKSEAVSQNSEGNRTKSLTPKIYATVTPAKPKIPNLNSSQRSTASMETMKEVENIDLATDSFSNVLNPFSVNNLNSKQTTKDILQKKQAATQKFLVLPRLNLYPEAQNQPNAPCWPVPSQNTKALAKSNFILDFANRPRFEKSQKALERPINQLMIDNKPASGEQDILSLSVGNQPIISRMLASYSNKSNYPMTLNPLDTVSNINKQIPL